MVRQRLIDDMNTSGTPDEQIAALVSDFQHVPHDFFREEELHARFYSRGQKAFPKYSTHDGHEVSVFRYRYDTIWRYRRGDRFAQRYRTTGTTDTFDFVILRRHFIQRSQHLGVLNRDESRRASLRCPHQEEPFYTCGPVQNAIELKMASLQYAAEVTEGDLNRLEDRMLLSTRKVAMERIQQAYVLGFSQGPAPDLARAHSMVASCLQQHQTLYPDGRLLVLVATPTQTVLGGDWPEDVEFPNVVVRSGWPTAASAGDEHQDEEPEA
jgi:hypothetical protein